MCAPECSSGETDVPQIIEEGTNPGWRIRVGVTRAFAEILDDAEEQGIWYETEKKMNAYVQRRLADRSSK